MTLTKNDIEFDFDSAIDAMMLGSEATGKHSNIRLVDFVVEFDDRYLFVEVIGTQNKKSQNDWRAFTSEKLCNTLARKYRDSVFFYLFGRTGRKEIEYSVLFVPTEVEPVLIMALQDELKRRIPVSHPLWEKESSLSCTIMNMAQWEKRYGEDSVRYAKNDTI